MTGSNDTRTAGARRRAAAHVGAFIGAGGLAFLTDALVLAILTHFVGMDPFLARIAAIALAMVAGWLAHRSWTFCVEQPPTFAEFWRYAGVAWSVAVLNYAVYAGLLIIAPLFPPLAAMTVSSLAAMLASYAGLRFAVFRPRGSQAR